MQIYSVYKAKNMIFSTLITLIFGVLFSIYSAQTKIGIISGITACTTMIIPSLFPFMALCNFFNLSGGGEFINKIFKYPAKLLLGKYYRFFHVFLLSLIGGYPIGATMLNTLVKTGKTDKITAQNVLLFSINTSPAFVIFAVGEGMLFSRKIGWILFLVNLLTSLLTLILTTRIVPLINKKHPHWNEDVNIKYLPLSDAFIEGVMKASVSTFFLCGFVVLFFGLNEIFSYMPLGKITAVISAIGEVTSSCAVLSAEGNTLPLISGVISFGGVCVLLQIVALSKEFSPKWWILLSAQIFKGILSGLLMWITLKIFPEISLWRYEEAISNMVTPGKFGISSSPITSACLILTAGVMLYYTVRIISNKENKINEEFGIYK